MMKNILPGVIFMILFVAGNAFAGGCPSPANPACNQQVPEPSTLLLMASGAASIGGIVLWRWKKK
ncbi:MAG: PEP-CTERM sorting domain-containing protein [Nitrospirae bacterium]|nr:PEP-CTERM sorting domain-containing protein [Nitrospirota bacterium]